MSQMKDRWGDTIEVIAVPGLVYIDFHTAGSMELDDALTRKLIKKLMRALKEAEDM